MKLWGLEWSSLDSYFQFVEQSASPATPESNHVRLYAKDRSSISSLYWKNDAGTEFDLGGMVTGLGTDNQVAIWNGTTAIDAFNATAGSVLFAGAGGILAQDNANFFWDDTNNDLVLGASVQPGSALLGRGMAIVRTAGVAELDLYGYSGTGTQVGLRLLKPRGSVATPTASQTDDGGFISFGGHDGSAFVYTGSEIKGRAAENWSGTNQGSYLSFSTIALASITLAERFRMGPSGQLGIGGATYGSSGNVLTSGGSGAAPSWAAPATQTSTLLDGSVHTDTVVQTVSRGSLVYGNATPKWDELAVGASAGMFLRTDATDAMWSTLILPNAITANQLVYGSATNTYGASADLTYDGTDLAIASGKRFRMQSQNRIRYLNSGAFAYRTTNQSINDSTFTAMSFDAEDFDTDGLHEAVTNPSRITIALTGKYFVSTTTYWAVSAVGSRFLVVRKNAVATDLLTAGMAGAVAGFPQNTNGILSLASGDYIEALVWQNSGGALNVTASGESVNLIAMYMGE